MQKIQAKPKSSRRVSKSKKNSKGNRDQRWSTSGNRAWDEGRGDIWLKKKQAAASFLLQALRVLRFFFSVTAKKIFRSDWCRDVGRPARVVHAAPPAAVAVPTTRYASKAQREVPAEESTAHERGAARVAH